MFGINVPVQQKGHAMIDQPHRTGMAQRMCRSKAMDHPAVVEQLLLGLVQGLAIVVQRVKAPVRIDRMGLKEIDKITGLIQKPAPVVGAVDKGGVGHGQPLHDGHFAPPQGISQSRYRG